jgi:hypothetical protein
MIQTDLMEGTSYSLLPHIVCFCWRGRISQYLAAALQNDISKVPDREDSKEKEVTAASFLLRWTSILSTLHQKTFLENPPIDLFTSLIYQPADPSTNLAQCAEYITEISIHVPRTLTDDGTATLLDALESLLRIGSKPACFKSLSDVLLIAVKREDHEDGAGVEIFPRLDVARFVWENYAQTDMDIAFRQGLVDGLNKLAKREEALAWIERGGKRIRAVEVLEATMAYIASLEGTAVFVEEEESDGEAGGRMDIDSERTLPTVTAELRSSLETLTNQLEGLTIPFFSG